ncbi:hypothetical protein BDW22DRAFT_1486599 [Trametopsis cervina]|nr:hypothetical protein BDW22DRAFT_1486599 [Trametopsis cervina]
MTSVKRSADSAFVVDDFPGTPESAPSPAASTSDYPPRKRSRSEVTPEERKEARAHRNRIAAQNSRDRRKAQFAHLERRVAELEEENRQLRAGKSVSVTSTSHEQQTRDLAREKENHELRERIKTLETGWDAVIKALAASGLPLRLRFRSPPSTGGDHRCPSFIIGVPAAGGFATNQLQLELSPSPSASTPQPIFSETSSPSPVDEGVMENLLREILAPSPLLSSTSLPIGITSEESPKPQSASIASQVTSSLTETTLDWEGEQEMQRLLDMLPDVHPDMKNLDVTIDAVDFSTSLDLDLSGWDLGSVQPPLVAVGTF